MFDRVRRSLVVANAIVIVALIALLGLGLTALLDRFLVAQRADDLRARAVDLVRQLRETGGGDEGEEGETGGFGRLGGTALVVWDLSGRVILNSASLPTDALADAAREVAEGADGSDEVSDEVLRLPSGDALVVSFPLSGVGGVVQLVEDLGPIRALERQIVVLVAGLGLIGVALAILAAWLLASRAMRPIRRAFERQREFTADASHELRTPLAVVDAGLQVLARHPEDPVATHAETLGAMREQTARMARLVAGLLTLARSDAGAAQVVRTEVDVDALVRRTVASFAPLAAERGATLEVGAGTPSAGVASIDGERVGELLGILVDNALRHGAPDGRAVRVRVAAGRTPRDEVELTVADDGPGIPPAERDRATERFVRGDAARSGDGAGLGLAIARSIAEAHDGRLTLEDARPGLLVRVTLPG